VEKETLREGSCYRIQVVADASYKIRNAVFWMDSNQLTMSIAEGGGGRAAAGTGTRRCCWGLGGGSGGVRPFGREGDDLWDMLNIERLNCLARNSAAERDACQ